MNIYMLNYLEKLFVCGKCSEELVQWSIDKEHGNVMIGECNQCETKWKFVVNARETT